MADDAGALLVRSGLVTSSALETARSHVAEGGGTLGEQLVSTGALTDEALTNFYKKRLLVPQVNPNMLARLPSTVVAVIPSDMAIELRAIPISLDDDNNLTIAMSDPSDRHAVDEIASFTGAYVVRAVATQMQIAWCLAHYYGHLTHLGERLLAEPDARESTPEITVTSAPLRDSEPTITMTAAPVVEDASTDGAASVGAPHELSLDSGPTITVTEEPEIDSGPVMTIEADEAEADEPAVEYDGRAPLPKRRRPAKPNPPELAARAGEVQLATGASIRRITFEEPAVVITEDLEAEERRPARARTAPLEASIQVSGELDSRETGEREVDPNSASIFVELGDEHSEPVLLDRVAARKLDETKPRFSVGSAGIPSGEIDDDPSDILLLPPKRIVPKRNRRTQVGIGVLPAATRARLAEEAGIPSKIEDDPAEADDDVTRFATRAAPARAGDHSGVGPAAPPPPASVRDFSPRIAPPRASSGAPPPSGQVPLDRVKRAPSHGDFEDEEGTGRNTLVMSSVELDATIPGRSSEVMPVARPATEPPEDEDSWGPPGTTIPPPLLGAVPGALARDSGFIPIADVDSAPLIVAPPSPPERGRRKASNSEVGLSRALESSTGRVLELIHTLDHTTDRDQVVAVMIAHLAETHHRAGFFAARAGELSLFAITPRVPAMPAGTLRLDRPSTLQDIVGTRLPYRGPMHDEASRMFLTATLGACPPEILLVPIAVRERVVGVLFGDHRIKHTFDDQLALASRAAGMALERILKTKQHR